MYGPGYQNLVTPRNADSHHGCFRNGRGSVVHGCVCNLHARQLADHGLKLEDGSKSPLRNFGLIWRIRSKELPARDHRIHDHGTVMVVNPGTEETGIPYGRFCAAPFEIVDNLELALAVFNSQAAIEANIFRNV